MFGMKQSTWIQLILKDSDAGWGCSQEYLASEKIKMKANWSRKRRGLFIFPLSFLQNGTWENWGGKNQQAAAGIYVDVIRENVNTEDDVFVF